MIALSAFEFICNCLLAGLLLGSFLFVLRSVIDRQKGFVVEVAGVAAPLLLATILYPLIVLWLWLGGSYSARELVGAENAWKIIFYLAPMVELTLLTLPALVIVRLAERLRHGESLQLSDLFRLTTIVSLGLFAFTSLDRVISIPALLITITVFWIAERSVASRKHSGRLLAFGIGFGFLSLAVVMVGLAMFSSYRFRYMDPSQPSWLPTFPLNRLYISLGLLAFAHSLALTPWLIERWLFRMPWFQRLAWKLSTWRFAIGSPRDSIYTATLFQLWKFEPGICYLNHGSFGTVPNMLRSWQTRIRNQQEDNPMNFLHRKIETLWLDAKLELAVWLGTSPENMAFCENATAGMNEIASWFPLQPGDEVLLNDHEYGAVRRIWQRQCDRHGGKLCQVELPLPLSNPQEITDAILNACTEKTKLVILSHITSPTAIRLPVESLCRELKQRGIATCIDGPHALLQERVKLNQLDCDFYVASCHKWLCAPIGTGFVYVAPKWHEQVEPARLSWGRIQPTAPEHWTDELLWTGTRDSSGYFTVPQAIRYFEQFNPLRLDQRNHQLACYARHQILKIPGTEPVTPEGREWFGWLVGIWLPAGDHTTLQQRLWVNHRIEIPIVHFGGRTLVRVSCHLYLTTRDIDFLVRTLTRELRGTSQAA